jgi:hypothetical protein
MTQLQWMVGSMWEVLMSSEVRLGAKVSKCKLFSYLVCLLYELIGYRGILRVSTATSPSFPLAIVKSQDLVTRN